MRINDYIFDPVKLSLTVGEQVIKQDVSFAGTVILLDSGELIRLPSLKDAQDLSAALQWVVNNWTEDPTKIHVNPEIVDATLKDVVIDGGK